MRIGAIFALNLLFAASLFVIKGRDLLDPTMAPDVAVAALALFLLAGLLPFGIWCLAALLRRRRAWPVRLHILTTVLGGGALVYGALRPLLGPG